LKKQSQFNGKKIAVNLYLKGNYGNIPLCGAQKTKPIKANCFGLSTACCVLRNGFEKTKPIL